MNKLTFALFALLWLAGCANTVTPNYDVNFGSALRDAKLKMTINPDAGKTAAPVVGMDGKAARETIIRYQDSFKTPPPVSNVINIGGSLTSGSPGGSGASGQ